MSRTAPRAALLVMRDVVAEAQAAGLTSPDVIAQHAAAALTAHGWHITGRPAPTEPTENP